MRTIFIYPNLRKESARAILPAVCEQLHGEDVQLILPNQLRSSTHELHDEVMALDYMETSEAVRLADAAVVLGGDGTMLRIARAAAQNELPLLGINVGHVGFMTELEPAELGEMRGLLAGKYSIDSRMMLHVAGRAARARGLRKRRAQRHCDCQGHGFPRGPRGYFGGRRGGHALQRRRRDCGDRPARRPTDCRRAAQ